MARTKSEAVVRLRRRRPHQPCSVVSAEAEEGDLRASQLVIPPNNKSPAQQPYPIDRSAEETGRAVPPRWGAPTHTKRSLGGESGSTSATVAPPPRG